MESGKWQVSTAGGHQPLWADDGRELFFRSATDEMMVAPVSTGSGFAVADRRVLFKMGSEYALGANYTQWDVSPNDQRFMLVRNRDAATTQQSSNLILVTNWFAELKAKTKQ